MTNDYPKPYLIAFLWGFAEGTFFFIVPDVWLSFIVVRYGLKKGMLACCYSVLGALVAGVFMYYWGAFDYVRASQLITKLPAINMDMMMSVRDALSSQGILAMMIGSLSGIPYKSYAISAYISGVDFISFLCMSIIARMMRFALVVSISYYAMLFIRRLILINAHKTLLIVWLIFYTWFFWVMPH